MAIIVSGGVSAGAIKHTAPKGMFNAVCVDVIDIGIKQTQWGEKPKVVVRWQIPAKDPDGNLHLVQKWYTKSLHEKAALRHDLESWRGREFTDEELKGFDLEKLLGANCQLLIVHKKGERGTFANVQAVTPAAAGKKLKLVPQGYSRKATPAVDEEEDSTPYYDESVTPETPSGDPADEPPF